MLRDWCIEVVILKNISLCEEFSFLQIEAAFWIWSCDHTCRIKRVLRFLCCVFDELVTDSWYVGEEVHVALLFSEAILFLVNCCKVKLWLHCQRRLLVYVCILKSIHYVEVYFCRPWRLCWQEGCVLISWRKPTFLWPATCSFALVRDCFLLVWKPLKAYLKLVL